MRNGDLDSDPGIDWDRVARYYDAHVSVDFDLAFWRREAARAGGPVLEVMCGSGRIGLPLVADGIPYSGLDLSAGLLAHFRAKLEVRGLSARLVHADARTFDLETRFAMAFIAFNALSEVTAAPQRAAVLACLHRHVAPGGYCIVTLHNPEVRRRALSFEPRRSGPFPLPENGGTLEVISRDRSFDPASGLVRSEQRYLERDRTGDLVADTLLMLRFCLVDPGEIAQELEAAGFTLEARFGDYDARPFTTDSRFAIVVARR